MGYVCRGNGLWEEVGYMGTSGNRDSQLASRNVLNDFTVNALAIAAVSYSDHVSPKCYLSGGDSSSISPG